MLGRSASISNLRGSSHAGQLQRLAERVDRLVDGEPRTIGRDLEEYSSRLAKVNRLEVVPIELRRDVVAKRCELGTNLHLLRFTRRPKRDVVHRSGSHHARPDAGNAAQVDDGAGTAVAGGVTEDAALLTNELESQSVW